MAVYLLDTSVIIDALNRKRGRWELLRGLAEGGDGLACSVVTLTEIYAGARLHEMEATEGFLAVLRTLRGGCKAGALGRPAQERMGEAGTHPLGSRCLDRSHGAPSRAGVGDRQPEGLSHDGVGLLSPFLKGSTPLH